MTCGTDALVCDSVAAVRRAGLGLPSGPLLPPNEAKALAAGRGCVIGEVRLSVFPQAAAGNLKPVSNPFQMRMGRRDAPPGLSGKAAGPLSDLRPLRVSRVLGAAQSALTNGEAERALAILEPLRAGHPRLPHVLVHLARAQSAAGDLDSALQTFDRAKEHSANNPIIDLFLGEALLQHGRMAEAEGALGRCLRKQPRNTIAANLLALCQFRQGRYRDAFSEWKRAGWSHNIAFLIEFTIAFERFLLEAPEPTAPDLPDPPEAAAPRAGGEPRPGLFARARQRRQLRRILNRTERELTAQRTREAWALTGEALALSANHSEALLLRAVALYELGRYGQAARLLLAVLRQENSTLPRCFLAYCLLRMGAVEIAEEILSRTLVEGPYDYYLHYHLALCRLIRGDLRGARRYFGVAYRDYFVDSREYCFEYLIQRVQAAVDRLEKGSSSEPGAEP